jgi:hypothetical protein
MPAKDWMDWVGLIIQALLLGGLIWYCIETRRIRIIAAGQLEALQTPCLTFVATLREGTAAVLDRGGAKGTLVLDFDQGSVMLMNIGTGPAVNIEYRFTPLDDAQSRPNGYVSFMGPGVRAAVPVPRGILRGQEYKCSLQYDSLSHTRYETRIVINDLVLTPPFRFDKL